jgi:hypothetical protein
MCDDCHWEAALEEMEDMIDSGDYPKAAIFLTSVSTWVEANKHITPAQHSKVIEIRDERWTK